MKLMDKVKRSLKFDIQSIHRWTDSTIVMRWINSPPKQWNVFVANRIAEIQKLITPEDWNHVKNGTHSCGYCVQRMFSQAPARLLVMVEWPGVLNQ